jgi:hypothetical protein
VFSRVRLDANRQEVADRRITKDRNERKRVRQCGQAGIDLGLATDLNPVRPLLARILKTVPYRVDHLVTRQTHDIPVDNDLIHRMAFSGGN